MHECEVADPFSLCSIHLRSTLKSPQNQVTLDTLVQEVRSTHSDFSSFAVTGNCELNLNNYWYDSYSYKLYW